jgi:uncharacterized protein (DUF1697 family)
MSKYISILRGINVGGNRKVPMADLKVAYQTADFQNVQTYIQSGNVVFDSEETNKRIIEAKIQEIIAETFGFNDIPVIVRSSEEWAESIANNPFLKEENVDIERLHLTCLKELPSPELLEKIKTFQYLQVRQAHCEPDRYEIIGKDVFIFCAAGYGKTKLTNSFFESKLKVQATTRNWKTVMQLNEMVKLM